MMKMFVNNHIVLFILVVTTAIDASRIFYLPLPKLHPAHQQIQAEQQVEKPSKKPLSDEFIPSSAIERDEIEKRGDNFDWETFLDSELNSKRNNAIDELLPGSLKELEEQYRLSRIYDKPASDAKKSVDNNQLSAEQSWDNGETLERAERLESNPSLSLMERKSRRNDTLFLMVIGACCAVGIVGLVGAAFFWHKIKQRAAAAADAEYPSYGVTGPNSGGSKISPSSTMSDRKLAQSAQMFHYQQQRQQMMAQEKAHLDAKPVNSDDSDDEAPGGGDYTVYECPGLAPTGEMEVRNPLFAEPETALTSAGLPSNSSNGDHGSTSVSSSPKEKSLQ